MFEIPVASLVAWLIGAALGLWLSTVVHRARRQRDLALRASRYWRRSCAFMQADARDHGRPLRPMPVRVPRG